MAELLGSFEQVVLLSIHKAGAEAYGREIFRNASAIFDRDVVAGAVYSTLDRLERKAYVSSHLEEGTAARAGRAKRYYTITPVGIKALNESKYALEQIWRSTKWPLESLV